MRKSSLAALVVLTFTVTASAFPSTYHSSTHYGTHTTTHHNSAGSTHHNYYTNSSGNRVHTPVHARSAPAGATAKCGDGTYSFSASHSGTCSHHGGISSRLAH